MRSSSRKPSDSSEEVVVFAGRDNTCRPLKVGQRRESPNKELNVGSSRASPRESQRINTNGDETEAAVALSGVPVTADTSNPVIKPLRKQEEPQSIANEAAKSENTQPRPRPLAEPPIFSYTEILEFLRASEKVLRKDPTITAEQRCSYLDIKGEKEAIGIYLLWTLDMNAAESDHEGAQFLRNLTMDLGRDYQSVVVELQLFFHDTGMHIKFQELKDNMPRDEWCSIFCSSNKHHKECPKSDAYTRSRHYRLLNEGQSQVI